MVVNERPKITKKGMFLCSELNYMSEPKNLDETAKKHMKHKPYKCDFGGGKNDRDN